jgi:hypothetical protein
MYKCKVCGYEGKDSEFSDMDMVCPACCTDIETGIKETNGIPAICHLENITRQCIEVEFFFNMNELKWRTLKGQEILVKDMTTPHIQNALNMLKNKGCIGVKHYIFYITCEPPTADGAYDAFMLEYNDVLRAPISLFIDAFETELKKRETRESK